MSITLPPIATGYMQVIQKSGMSISNKIFEQTKTFGNVAIHLWGKEDILSSPITHLFLGIAFKCTLSYLCPGIAGIVPDYLLVSLPMFIERVRNSCKEVFHFRKLQRLEEENCKLTKLQREMACKTDILEITNRRVSWEKKLAIEEKSIAEKKLDDEVLGNAPVLIQRDDLLETKESMLQENITLQDQIQKLSSKIEEMAQEKQSLDRDYANVSKARAEAETNLELSGGYVELRGLLSQLNHFYMQILKQEKGHGEVSSALTSLMDAYESNKRKIHAILHTTIEKLPVEDPNKIILGEMLRISQQEMPLTRVLFQATHISIIPN